MPSLRDLPPCGLPVDNPTEPFWLSERSRLDRHRTTETLPEAADVVIVGSGLSGALLAYHLLRANPALHIVMLEARGTCTGASARNGGQVKTDPYVIYNHLKARYGSHTANELLNFETNHLALFEDFLADEPGIDCAFHITTAFDVCMTDSMARTAEASFHARQQDFPDDMAAYRELVSAEEIKRVTGVQGAKWAAMYRVASIWPYKLATGVLERCFVLATSGGGSFALHTTTPVLSLSTRGEREHVVKTPRGELIARQVAVCTNGYASNLLPELANRVIPVRGTASSLLPPERQPVGTPSAKIFRPLFTSYALKFGDGGRGEYMISRQEGRREMILGGAKHVYVDDPTSWYGVYDDSKHPGAQQYFDGYMPKHLVNWPDATSNLDKVWTGILGYSSDSFPWVGQLPGRPQGVYTMAGFHGHGMCRILGSTQALTKLMLSGHAGQAGFEVLQRASLPENYLITEARLRSKDNEVLAGIEQGQAVKARL